MKRLKLLSLAVLFVFASCSSVRVTTDYDSKANFNQYKTYAFYKKGIDKVDISDLDKRRILKAIEVELNEKGYVKSTSPDLLVNIFAKSRKKVDIYNHHYFGWYPWYYGPNPVHISQYTEGTLFIDLIDANQKEMVWQGIGSGALSLKSVPKKEERIKEFVAEIMAKYPPALN